MAKVGRPTKYKREYCKALIEHMTDGASIASFAASIDVGRSTINLWADHHPEFMEALKAGKAKCAAWWEERVREIAREGGATGQATAVIFGLKNMASEDWRDRQEITHRDADTDDLTAYSDTDLENMIRQSESESQTQH